MGRENSLEGELHRRENFLEVKFPRGRISYG